MFRLANNDTKGGDDKPINPAASSKSTLSSETVISEALIHFFKLVVKECAKLRSEKQETRQFVFNAMLGAMAALIAGLGRFTVQETVQGLHDAAALFDPNTGSIGKTAVGEARATRKANWQD